MCIYIPFHWRLLQISSSFWWSLFFFFPLGADPYFWISSKNLVWIIRILIKDFVSVTSLPFRLQSSKIVTFWLLGKSYLSSQKIQLMFFFNRLLMFEAGWNEELSSFKKCQQPKCLNPEWNWSRVYFLSALGKRWHLKWISEIN